MVDDHAPWRQQITSLLEETGEWRVTGEAADGPEAVAMAAALDPDLILLDVELPTLSGVAAAARILADNPTSRILYLSGHRAWVVVEAALVAGARGYVLKPYAGLELLPAMAAVVAGRRYISTVLGGRAVLPDGTPTPHVHEAAFHQSERTLLADYEAFAAGALSRGKAVIGVGDAARRLALVGALRLRGIDIDRAIKEGRFRMLETGEVLQPMIVDGMPDETRFWQDAIRLALGAARASRQDPPAIAAFGDDAQALCHGSHGGNSDAGIRIEQLWDEFARTFNVDVLCGYVGRPEECTYYDAICATHTAAHTR